MEREVVVNQIEGAKQVDSTIEESKVEAIEDLDDMVDSFNSLLAEFECGDGDLFYKPKVDAIDKIEKIRGKYEDLGNKSKLKVQQKSLLSAVKRYISALQGGLHQLDREGK